MKGLFWKIVIQTRWHLPRRHSKGALIGERAPDFTLRDLSGRPYTLSETFPQKGAVLWLTNLCPSCEERIPLLQKIYKADRDHLEIFAVSTLGKDRTTPERILQTHRIDFPLLLDPEDWVGTVLGFPHPQGACPLYNLLLLDRFGTVRLRSHLSAIKEEDFLKAIESLAVIPSEERRKNDAA
jgi:peroxiredoxin